MQAYTVILRSPQKIGIYRRFYGRSVFYWPAFSIFSLFLKERKSTPYRSFLADETVLLWGTVARPHNTGQHKAAQDSTREKERKK